MTKVKIFTNQVLPAWEPEDIKTFLGGSEELIVLFSEALQRIGFNVSVYHTSKTPIKKEHNGVKYAPRELAKCDSDDIFITWKDSTPWRNGAKAKINIHWTADIEQSWGFNQQTNQLNINSVDHFVNISNYQQRKNIFVPYTKECVIPLGVDIKSLDKNKQPTGENTILYCSSPDRGLLQLLSDWKQIKQKQPELKLKIAYGYGNFNTQNLEFRRFKNTIDELIKQPDIEHLGSLKRDEIEKEYWKAQYWILPLNNPDSELFCLNAVKSRYCGCVSIVNKIGALTETVSDYIPYNSFVNGKLKLLEEKATWDAISWDDVVKKYWVPILKGAE